MLEAKISLLLIALACAAVGVANRKRWLTRLKTHHEEAWDHLGRPELTLRGGAKSKHLNLIFSSRLDSLEDQLLSRAVAREKAAVIVSVLAALIYCGLFVIERL